MERIAVLGPEGTFCDSAYHAYRRMAPGGGEAVYFSTIDETFHAVGRSCPAGIVPVENTLDGYVQRSLDLLLEQDLHIASELTVPVQFSLAANAASLAEVRTLFVQFKAGGQCRRLTDGMPGVRIVTTQSNMESFYRGREGLPGTAAVIPQHMYRPEEWRFGLENVTDAEKNATRFLVIRPGAARLPDRLDGEVRVPLYVMPAFDEPGVLFRVLKIFNDHRINLVSLMSRPTKTDLGTYRFYLELSGDGARWDALARSVAEVSAQFPVKVLGAYSCRRERP